MITERQTLDDAAAASSRFFEDEHTDDDFVEMEFCVKVDDLVVTLFGILIFLIFLSCSAGMRFTMSSMTAAI